jgi:hypothetical protein
MQIPFWDQIISHSSIIPSMTPCLSGGHKIHFIISFATRSQEPKPQIEPQVAKPKRKRKAKAGSL